MSISFENVKSPNVCNSVISDDDDIVITGFSGRLPECSNIEEFKQKLFDGIDLVTDDERRWPSGLYGLPTRTGKLKDLAHFDASFFGVHAKQAQVMDPQQRMLLELTQEAIIDAGINPSDLRGSKTGVFIGAMDSESDEFWAADPEMENGYGSLGCSRALFANRISYSFDFQGPSFAVDSGCSASFSAMHQAVTAIRTGQCDSAIIGGVNLVLKPMRSLQFYKMSMLSMDGACKSFDSSANGFVRSEAAVVLFLQKLRNSRRVYATVVNSKVNVDGYKVTGITHPNGDIQRKLMQEVYSEVGIDPVEVAYIEAHGTGTKVGDPQEVNAIAELFCKDRKQPLLIGSVKSNMGHSEPASGLCSIVKTLIAMETGIIPGNLHFKNPNTDIPALSDGRLQVVDRSTPWNGGLVGISSFGFGGANAHVVLRSNPKPKIDPIFNTNILKMVAVSGRTEDAVNIFLDRIKENERDDEFTSIVQELHANNIEGHGYRGYQIFGNVNSREVSQVRSENRPIWYIFPGLGSQWTGMGRSLFCIDTFQSAIRRCAEALKPEGIDLINLILKGSKENFENIINNIVTITAIQIGLVDVLSLIGIQPDGIIGHSNGELLCGYADGTMTPEQTVLAAYWRSKTVLDGNLPKGAMAVVSLSWEEIEKRCPTDIFPACHNAANSVTISGPSKSIIKFVDELKNEKISVKEINSCGFAFHSKYIASVEPKLRALLEKLIPNPKPRTSRWISSSITKKNWNRPLAKLCSPAYYINNFLSPVLFHEALGHVPENAIVIEIAPDAFFQSILRRSLPATVIKLSLQKRYHSDNVAFLLTNIGKLYVHGAQPNLLKLYPSVTYPVGRGTPMLNSMVQWDHSVQWSVADFSGKSEKSGQSVVKFDLFKETDAYIAGHCIDGRIIFPATGYLTIVWKTFAKIRGSSFEKTPVVFEAVKFHRATIMSQKGSVQFNINFFKGTGAFEVCESGSLVATGKIQVPEEIKKEQLNLPVPITRNEPDLLELKTDDVYKDFRLRGYEYSGIFQGIKSSDNRGICGSLAWNNDWISFIDTILQFTILGKNTRKLFIPTELQYASINPESHLQIVQKLQANEGISVYNYNEIEIVKSGGIEIRGLKTCLTSKRHQTQPDPKHEKYIFKPYENVQVFVEDIKKSKLQALTVLLQVVCENMGIKIKAVETTAQRNPNELLIPLVQEILLGEPNLAFDLKLATTVPENYNSFMEQCNVKSVVVDEHSTPIGQDLQLIITANVMNNTMSEVLKNLEASLKPGGFILTEETNQIDLNILTGSNLILVAEQITTERSYILLKQREEEKGLVIVKVTEKNFSWVNDLKAALKKSEKTGQKFLVLSQGEELLGLAGLMTCIRHEPGGLSARYFFIQDKNAAAFSLDDAFYAKQFKKQLRSNVLKDGQWGSYRHLRLDKKSDFALRQVEHAYINVLIRGDLSSLRWIESPLRYYTPEKFIGKKFCRVFYASLNFRDIMLATGKLKPDGLFDDSTSEDSILGFEFAGKDTSGNRVMGIVAAHGLATTVLADPGFMWEVPDKWTLEQAATVPVVYATGYYALVVRGRLQPGESVLIHAGSGGVGQASIAIAIHFGCTVFTTVSSTEKRDLLKKTFPQLTDNNIGNSRDTSFEQLVLSETNGRGVDLVLNSLSEEKLLASVRCLAKRGRFLEIGKFDLSNNASLGMSFFLKNTTFHGIFLDDLFNNDDPVKKEVVQLVYEGIKNGTVRPLRATVFNDQEIEEGFRFMAAGKHIGKVLIKIRNEESEKVIRPVAKTVATIRRTYMNPDKSYVLVGGLGGFGLELANWMITRGAKSIVLTSRSGIRTGYQSLCIRRWREKGIRIEISTSDVTTEAGADFLLKEANKLAPVGGIFNLAAVLHDAFVENLEEEHFKIVALPKVNATKNLDLSSKEHCPELDFFVCFSSISCGRGISGQTNYGFANSAMERIMEKRKAAGLPGLAIQWGAVGDVGLVWKSIGTNETKIVGTLPQRISSCLRSMDSFLHQPHAILSSMVLPEKQKSSDLSNPDNLLDTVANILGIKNIKTSNMSTILFDLGMDSLMGTEIKQTLERSYNLVLSAQEIRALTFGKLLELSSGSTDTSGESFLISANNLETKTYSDELLFQCSGIEIIPTESLVQLQSKSKADGEPLFLIHGIEGFASAFKYLAGELEQPVWGMQCTKDTPLDSISTLATHYIQSMRTIKNQDPYRIVGYSFGACVAIEMGLQLEKAGESVVLTVIDGSPDFSTFHSLKIGRQMNQINTDFTSNDGFQKAVAFFAKLLNSQVSYVKAYEILNESKSEDEMLNNMLKLIGNKSFKSEDLKIAAILLYKKLLAANLYKASCKYNGIITLIKARDNFSSLKNDYGLSEICKQKVRIEELPGNHRSILSGESVKKIAEVLKT